MISSFCVPRPFSSSFRRESLHPYPRIHCVISQNDSKSQTPFATFNPHPQGPTQFDQLVTHHSTQYPRTQLFLFKTRIHYQHSLKSSLLHTSRLTVQIKNRHDLRYSILATQLASARHPINIPLERWIKTASSSDLKISCLQLCEGHRIEGNICSSSSSSSSLNSTQIKLTSTIPCPSIPSSD